MNRDAFFIDGGWRPPASTGVIESVSSATVDPIGPSPEALAIALEKRITEIGRLVAQEVGTPVAFAGMANATGPAHHLRRLGIGRGEPLHHGRGCALRQPQGERPRL